MQGCVETKWKSVWKLVFNEGTETRSCLCVVLFLVCSNVLEVSGGCSSERALKREAVWTEYAQMCCGYMHSFKIEERTAVPTCLCVLCWNWFTNELASCRNHRKNEDFRAI